MLKFKHATLITLAGISWMLMGIFLMNVGLRLIAERSLIGGGPVLNFLNSLFGGLQEAAVALIGIALVIGYFKGRFVLSKTVKKMVKRITSFSSPVSFHLIYSLKFYLLIACMILLGVLLRYFNVAGDVRGIVDIAVGSALINGAVTYFKEAQEVRKAEKKLTYGN